MGEHALNAVKLCETKSIVHIHRVAILVRALGGISLKVHITVWVT